MKIEKDEILDDVFGIAAQDFFYTNLNSEIIVESVTMENDIIPASYLFRRYADFPSIEKEMLNHIKGNVLEIGGGVGSHALQIQKTNDVTLIDDSEGCVKIALERGINNAICTKIEDFNPDHKFDSIIGFMNSLGLAGTINQLPVFLDKLMGMLNKSGVLILDSTNIEQVYIDSGENYSRELNNSYYGLVSYKMKYKSYQTKWFNWLYIDFKSLKEICSKLNLNVIKIFEENNHYCVVISKN